LSSSDVEFATKTLLSLVPDAKEITATTLSGGVSCDTIKVNWHNGSGVIKRALAQLRVPGTWEADVDRILAEGDAITMYHQLTPEFVPKLLGRNDDELAIMLELAPEDMSEWRLQMLEGIVNPTIGSELGKVLGIWHNKTTGVHLPPRIENGKKRLYDLRAGAFYGGMAKIWPEHESLISSCAKELMESMECAVHGDFSPKNILAGPSGTWVLDFEVTHKGAPVFDLAFMCAHLIIKSIHLEDQRELLLETIANFLSAYKEQRGEIPGNLGHHVGIITAVRVVGISQVKYLNDSAKVKVIEKARSLLDGAELI
jgi:5-methylthioribose kinase